ncbi:hypothetical protein [Streptomyces regalis]|uniref:Uncharacterized protein n=1 Tax=Streptomyces regalis TaxID=68262 RepID=A0A0X3VTE4_9ACTN|nr:hypothetical protein [Streptomyces regalis]KUL46926.1 hypothetical protein ADL12_00300 [Streptomyces regalis]
MRNDLPHDITAFTGRRTELDTFLGAARNTTMVAIDGMGGAAGAADRARVAARQDSRRGRRAGRAVAVGAGGAIVLLDGVQPISLDVLPTQKAAELFVESAGGTRPGDVGEVLRRCGNLPLAIRVAAARLRHRPAWTLDTLMERLRESELAVSDVFEMSLRQLDPAQRRMFGLLGLVPGEDIDAYGAAALAGIPLANTRSLLEDLVDVHPVQESAAGRYRMHDLLRQAARADDAAADPGPAIARLGDYCLSGMPAVTEVIELVVTPVPVIVSQQPPALPDLSRDGALDWLDAEWANITATFSLAVESGIDASAVGLGQFAFVISLGRRGGMAQVCRGLEVSMPAAETLGERRVLASHRWPRRATSSARRAAGPDRRREPEITEALDAARPDADPRNHRVSRGPAPRDTALLGRGGRFSTVRRDRFRQFPGSWRSRAEGLLEF